MKNSKCFYHFSGYMRIEKINIDSCLLFCVYQNSLNRGKSRTDNSWDDAVSSLCHGANVYRFLTEDISEEENASSNASKC